MIEVIPTKEQIFSKVDSYQIFKWYCTNFKKIGTMFSSEFRSDSSPSCNIIYYKGDLLYKDFGEKSYRAIDFVMRKYNLTYREALIRINDDMQLGIGYNSDKKIKKSKINISEKLPVEYKIDKTPTIIKIKSKPYSIYDLKYWNDHGWTKEMLIKAKIKAISHYFLTMEHKNIFNKMYNVNNDLAYSYDYYWNDDVFRRKLYFPEKSNLKFLSNVDDTIIQGWDLLSKQGGDILFITSSFKDTGVFWRLFGKPVAIAPNSEKLFIKERPFYKLKQRWKRIIIWHNNDDVGIRFARQYAEKYKLEYYYNPIGSPKDPSDFTKYEGLRSFNELLKSII